jgi:inosine-uridine nucleoside N-ribohydrolase
LSDPELANRIRVVAMAFPSASGGEEYNVQNDVVAWQVLLASRMPLVIGPGDICRTYLSLNFAEARDLISSHGPVGAWLWHDYQLWYFREVKPLRRPDFSKSWVIWDIITLAYLEGLTTSDTKPRPRLKDDMSFAPAGNQATVTWIKTVDSKRLWADFLLKLDAFERSHAVPRFEAP